MDPGGRARLQAGQCHQQACRHDIRNVVTTGQPINSADSTRSEGRAVCQSPLWIPAESRGDISLTRVTSISRGDALHIGFRRSGGRGEYEVVGSQSGYTAIGLEGWSFDLFWPDGNVRETGLALEPASSGKPRLRSLGDPPFQVGRMLASMLLLPDPRRAFDGVADGEPLARRKAYVLSRLGFGARTAFTDLTKVVTIDPTYVELQNHTETADFGVAFRWARIVAVYEQIEYLPGGVSGLLAQHRDYMTSGEPITSRLSQIVNDLIKILPAYVREWSAETDPLPALERMLAISTPDGPSLPPPDELGDNEPEVSVRAAHEYRLAKFRGAAGRRFSSQVRAAYDHTCAFCGARLGGVSGVRSGVDAAHILAWSKYDLDIVQNGLTLCKLHHWAFDAALLLPVFEAGSYKLRFTTLADDFDAGARSRISEPGATISELWLPSDPALRPSEKYLRALYADLAIDFSA